MRFDPVTAFQTADASKKVYSVVRGSFSFDQDGAPESYDEDAPEEWLTNGHISGHMLTPEGFTTAVDADVVVVIGCVGPWCAATQASEDALMFVRQEASGRALYLDIDPCASNVFPSPSKADFDAMEACLAGNCPAVSN